MIALGIIFGSILLLLLGVLMAPVVLTIDTDEDLYRLQIIGLGEARIVPTWDTDWLIALRWRVWFFRREFRPLEWLTQPRPAKPGKKSTSDPGDQRKKSRGQGRFSPPSWHRIRHLLQSFQVHQCQIAISSDDPIRNVWLFPLAYALSGPNRQISVNFIEYRAVKLRISNRLIRVLWAWLA